MWIIITLSFLIVFCIYMFVRNHYIYKIRKQVLHEIDEDFHNTRDYLTNYMMGLYLYDAMLWRFWMSLSKLELKLREGVFENEEDKYYRINDKEFKQDYNLREGVVKND